MTQPTITGKSRIGRNAGAGGGRSFAAFDPARGEELRERFFDASPEEIDRAMQLASRSRRGGALGSASSRAICRRRAS